MVSSGIVGTGVCENVGEATVGTIDGLLTVLIVGCGVGCSWRAGIVIGDRPATETSGASSVIARNGSGAIDTSGGATLIGGVLARFTDGDGMLTSGTCGELICGAGIEIGCGLAAVTLGAGMLTRLGAGAEMFGDGIAIAGVFVDITNGG